MTTNTIPILPIVKRLGRDHWRPPVPFGPSGWQIDNYDGRTRVLITDSPMAEDNGEWWRHASISHVDQMPDYEELTRLHRAVWPNGWAYQMFAAPADHVNIHEFTLHLWGRPDGRMVLPNFGSRGTI